MGHVSGTIRKKLAGGTHEHHAAPLIIRKTLRWNMQESGSPQGDATNRLFRPSGITFAGILGRLPVSVGSLCSLRERM